MFTTAAVCCVVVLLHFQESEAADAKGPKVTDKVQVILLKIVDLDLYTCNKL